MNDDFENLSIARDRAVHRAVTPVRAGERPRTRVTDLGIVRTQEPSTQLTQGVKLDLVPARDTRWEPTFRLRLPEFDDDVEVNWRRLRSWKSVVKACREQLGQPPTWEPENGWHWRAIVSELTYEMLVELWRKANPLLVHGAFKA